MIHLLSQFQGCFSGHCPNSSFLFVLGNIPLGFVSHEVQRKFHCREIHFLQKRHSQDLGVKLQRRSRISNSVHGLLEQKILKYGFNGMKQLSNGVPILKCKTRLHATDCISFYITLSFLWAFENGSPC